VLETLRTIYLHALDACTPERLIRVTPDVPRKVVAIGKCAGALRDGLDDDVDAFVAVPASYRRPVKRAKVVEGGHPNITAASFEAGRQLLDFVDAHDEVLFLISGGGSPCVEQPLKPWFNERDLIDINDKLVASGLKIGDINCVRKHLSAIKGGRLAARVKRSVTLVYSDVATGALADVASGPTLADATTKDEAIAILRRLGGCDRIVARLRDDGCPDTVKAIDDSRVQLIADNSTLVAAAAEIAKELGLAPVVVEQQIESDVADAAHELLQMAEGLRSGEVLIAGGEPTVERRGNGKGGRCIELAVRMALAEGTMNIDALLGTSDGVDGNSGVAAVAIELPASVDQAFAKRELANSNSLAVIERIGETITIPPAGNNLRDLYLLARRCVKRS
jgi:hydroxypyruvate reductase